MKRFLMKTVDKRIFGIPILAHIIAITFAIVFAFAGVIAATILIIPSTVSVIESPGGGGGPTPGPPTYDIAAFIDSECTIPLASIDWGNIQRGNSDNITVYIKNTGTGNASVSANTTNLSTDIVLSGGPLLLNADSSGAFDLTLTVSDNATLDFYEFEIVFTSVTE